MITKFHYKRKSTVFVWVVLSLMLLLEIIECIDMWSYNEKSYDNCELELLLLNGLAFLIFTNLILLLSYQYFHNANKIFKFSKTGLLPDKISQKRNKSLLMMISIIATILGCIYVVLMLWSNSKENWKVYAKLQMIS